MIVAVPLKLVAGVNTRFVAPTMTTVPLVAVAPVMMSGSPSGSLANDSDPDGDPLIITGATATNGTVVIVGATNLVFTPATNFNGTATIIYTISDGKGGSASA